MAYVRDTVPRPGDAEQARTDALVVSQLLRRASRGGNAMSVPELDCYLRWCKRRERAPAGQKAPKGQMSMDELHARCVERRERQ